MATIKSDVEPLKMDVKPRKSCEKIQLLILLTEDDFFQIARKEGEDLYRLRAEYNVDVEISDIGEFNQVFAFTGALDDCLDIFREVMPFCNIRAQYSTYQVCKREVNLLVHTDTIGSVLGKGGTNIKKIREGTDTKIKVYKHCLLDSNLRVIAIGADREENIFLALEQIMNVLLCLPKMYTYTPVSKPNEIQSSGKLDRVPGIQSTYWDDGNNIARPLLDTYWDDGKNIDKPTYYQQTIFNIYNKCNESGSSLDNPLVSSHINDTDPGQALSVGHYQPDRSSSDRYMEQLCRERDRLIELGRPDSYDQAGCSSYNQYSEPGRNSDLHDEYRAGYSSHDRYNESGKSNDVPPNYHSSGYYDLDGDYHQSGYRSHGYSEIGCDQPGDYFQRGLPAPSEGKEGNNHSHLSSSRNQEYYNTHKTETDCSQGHLDDNNQLQNSIHDRSGNNNHDYPTDRSQMGYSSHNRERESESSREHCNDMVVYNKDRCTETLSSHEFTSDPRQAGYSWQDSKYTFDPHSTTLNTPRDGESLFNHSRIADISTCREIESDNRHDNHSNTDRVGIDLLHRDNKTGTNMEKYNETNVIPQNTSPFLNAETETKLIVPNDICGAIIGRGGLTIKDIRTTSGAKIDFSESNKKVKQDRTITITGTQRQVQSAENLMTEAVRNRTKFK